MGDFVSVHVVYTVIHTTGSPTCSRGLCIGEVMEEGWKKIL